MKIEFFKLSDNRPDVTLPSLNTTDPTILALAWLGCNVPVDEFVAIDIDRLVEVSGLENCLILPMLEELAYHKALVRKPTETGGFIYQRRPLINKISSALVLKGAKNRCEKGGAKPEEYAERVKRPLRVPTTNTVERLVDELEQKYPIQQEDTSVSNGCSVIYRQPSLAPAAFVLPNPTPPVESKPVVLAEEHSTSLATCDEEPTPTLPIVSLPADLIKYGYTVNSGPVIWCEDKADMQERVDGYLEIDGSVQIDVVKRIGKVMYKPTVILDEVA